MWLLLAASSPAYAAGSSDESERWVPSLGVFFDALGQKGFGSVATSDVFGPPLGGPDTDGDGDGDWDVEQDAFANGDGCLLRNFNTTPPTYTRSGTLCNSRRPPNPRKLLNDREGSDTSVAPMVGGSLELMTPSLFDALLRPRLFVHGDLAAAFGFERNLAGQESPGTFGFAEGLAVKQPAEQDDVEELAITGQGSRTRMQVRRWVFSAGGGIAFSLDLFGRRVRIKPSLEYLRYELDLIGVVHRAVKLQLPSGAADLSGFRLVSLTKQKTQSYDGIGPGLEIEVDTTRLGPFVSSVYFSGRGYHLFGDLKTSLSATNQYGESATWTFDPENWVWRGGVGFRLRWLPESD